MPNYQVTAPDGRKYRVTAPEGATQEQALAYAQQNYRQAQQPPASGPREKYQQSDGTRLHKIELALRAADAVGNVEDARRLARAYVAERDSQRGLQAPSQQQIQVSSEEHTSELQTLIRTSHAVFC